MGREEPRLDNDNKNQGHDQTTELKYLLSLQKTKKKKRTRQSSNRGETLKYYLQYVILVGERSFSDPFSTG